MMAGLIVLCLGYVLSQFFRAFLAVLAAMLERDIGAAPDDLAFASGLWFLAFAAMQIPVGWALDRVGPRRTAAVLLFLGGGGGALVFALASAPVHVSIAMLLIGIGCSPVLMASYYIFARQFPPARFATLAALMLGVGSVGNLVAAYPTALAADLLGWRGTLIGLAAISAAVAVGIWFTVRDPERVASSVGGSVLDLLRMPALWLIFPLSFFQYAPAAGLRGLWVGPYLTDVFGASAAVVGQVSLLMGAAMIAGTFAYGPLDRLLGTRKWVVFGGNVAALMALIALSVLPPDSLWRAAALFAAVGLFGASFPVIMAHGRSFYPDHLVGRGVTLMNLFAIGGVGAMQVLTGRVYAAADALGGPPAATYQPLFLVFSGTVLFGLLIYVFSREAP